MGTVMTTVKWVKQSWLPLEDWDVHLSSSMTQDPEDVPQATHHCSPHYHHHQWLVQMRCVPLIVRLPSTPCQCLKQICQTLSSSISETNYHQVTNFLQYEVLRHMSLAHRIFKIFDEVWRLMPITIWIFKIFDEI